MFTQSKPKHLQLETILISDDIVYSEKSLTFMGFSPTWRQLHFDLYVQYPACIMYMPLEL